METVQGRCDVAVVDSIVGSFSLIEQIQSGTKIYFQAYEDDQHKATSLSNTSEIPKSMLLLFAQRAFRKKAVNKTKMQDIDDSWSLVVDAKEKEYKDSDTKYAHFKAHYTKHLRNWIQNTKDNTSAQANMVEE
uniref:Uncharacterized protein n=1 Tax=Pseudo-nitzschia australis TaxID=44445 RepID=A0A6V0BGG4_9STRA|mmetsp:Transcript_7402/g.14505  ORF Transcript_7402/g.14505 Transcript_7402/m.14505 type:complete len:133 (-) Transcript_7402:30-428(-)